jgi:hypothetical protein
MPGLPKLMGQWLLTKNSHYKAAAVSTQQRAKNFFPFYYESAPQV